VPGISSLRSSAGLPALRRLGQPAAWRGRPDALDAAWVSLVLLGLACIVIYARWQAVPFHFIWITLLLLMFGLVMRYAHRRQAADTERARVSEENARLLAAQRRFLQDASHQLKTPITIALGHAELLAGSLTDPRHSRDVHVVVGELTKLKSLAEKLLLIATSENSDFLRPEPVALDGFIMEVLRRWRPTAERRWQLGRLDPVTVNHLPAPVKHDVFFAIAHAIDGVFVWAVPAAILVFILAWFIKEVPLRSSATPPPSETPATEPEFAA